MPALGAELASAVAKAAASSSFQPLDAGKYRFRLTEVTTGEAKSGNVMWTWVYTLIGDMNGEHKRNGYKIWDRTVLTEKALWRWDAVFSAFGVPHETHTDLLVGNTVVLDLDVREIPTGQRKGQMSNEVTALAWDDAPDAVHYGLAVNPAKAAAEAQVAKSEDAGTAESWPTDPAGNELPF